MASKHIVLITGGNTGIGYETVKALFESPNPYTILMGSRSLSKANDAISTITGSSKSSSEIIPIQIDIEDDASIDKAFSEVEKNFGRVDTLINNAGAQFDFLIEGTPPTSSSIRAAYDKSYSLNVTSTQVFTTRFAPLLLKSSSPRLLFLTSGLSSLTTNSDGSVKVFIGKAPPAGWPKPPTGFSALAYRCSKVALNMLMLDWARLLEEDGVKVFAISPGFLATGLAGKEEMKAKGAQDASVGGIFIRKVVEGERDEDHAKIIRDGGVQPW